MNGQFTVKMILDSGCSGTLISIAEAKYLYEKGCFTQDDILGTTQSQIADGSIVERTEYRAVNNEYFRIKEESEALRKRLNHYENDTADGVFDYAEKIAWLNASPEYRILETYEEYSGDIDDINEELKDPTLRDDERKELEAELNQKKKELVDAVNAVRNGKR